MNLTISHHGGACCSNDVLSSCLISSVLESDFGSTVACGSEITLSEGGFIAPIDFAEEIVVATLEIFAFQERISLMELFCSGNILNVSGVCWVKVSSSFDQEHLAIGIIVSCISGHHSFSKL